MTIALAIGARWMTVAQAVKVATQLASITILARILSPEQYGLMAMAVMVLNFAILFRDMGTAAALIQKEELDEALCVSAHWFSIWTGCILCALICIGAPVFALVFRTDELTLVLVLLAFTLPVASSSVVRLALLERKGAFRRIALGEMAAALLALAIAIGLALGGAGVYSLVAQSWATVLISSVVFRLSGVWSPTGKADFRALLSVARFSRNLVAFNFINYFSRNTDSMIIGQRLGAEALGFYSLAYRVMLFPVQNITAVASRTLYPALSRARAVPRQMAEIYLKSIGVIVGLSAPLMVGLFVLRQSFVLEVFGPSWAEAVKLIAILAPVGYIQSIVSTTGAVSMALGKTDLLLRLGIFNCVLQVSGFIIGARWGLGGIAISYLVTNIINAVPCLWLTLRNMDVSLWDLARAIFVPTAAALLMAGGLEFDLVSRYGWGVSSFQAMIIQILCGGIFYIVALALFRVIPWFPRPFGAGP